MLISIFVSHDLCLYSRDGAEFQLIGNPDADELGRSVVANGDVSAVVSWYESYCRDLEWDANTWFYHLSPPLAPRGAPFGAVFSTARHDDAWFIDSCDADSDCCSPSPEWATPDMVARHIAMVDAFLAFAPGAKFGAS